MAKKMTIMGIAPKLAAIHFPYLLITIILQLKRPDLFSITQIPYLALIIIGIILIIVGLFFWFSSAKVIYKAFKEGRLLTKGIFGIVRNPLYSGLVIFFSTGLALCFRSWLMLTVPIIAYLVFKLLIKQEDNYLEKKFGQEFLDYKSKVNAIIPFPHFSKKDNR